MSTGLAHSRERTDGPAAAVRVRSTRLPGLDGLRGVAILAVLVFHLDAGWLPGGFLGVDIFFVISGFLITTLLVREHRWTGTVGLRAFWTRRARRLLPALLSVVVLTPLLAQTVQRDLLVGIGRQVLGALTFTTNWVEIAAGSDYFHATSPQLLMNLWSLAVEEQFYLLWPLVTLALLATVRSTRTRVLLVAAVGLGSAALMATWLDPEAPTRVYYGTDTHLVGLMLGAALALGFAAPHRAWTSTAAWERHRRSLVGGAGVILVALVVLLDESSALTFRGGILLACLATAVLVLGAVERPGRLRALLLTPWLAWIGERSYGLYLWHWPVILLVDAEYAAQPGGTAYLWSRVWAVVVTVAIADLSYRFLETPVRRHGLRGSLRTARGWVGDAGPWRPRLVWGACLLTAAALVAVLATAPSTSSTEDLLARNAAAAAPGAAAAAPAPKAVPPQEPAIAVPKASFTMPSGAEIDAVGDSMLVGAVHAMKYYFPGIRVDAKSNRRWQQGAAILEGQGSAVRRGVVLSLGTNGGMDAAQVERVLSLLGPDRMVVILTTHGRFSRIEQDNATLREIAARHPNVAIADWHAALRGTSGNLQPDGIHATIKGAHLYASLVRQAFATLSEKHTGVSVPLKPLPIP